jgi:hypothetical protein
MRIVENADSRRVFSVLPMCDDAVNLRLLMSLL